MNTCQLKFEFQVDETTTFELEAQVELHHSTPHYVVKNIHLSGSHRKTPVMPDANITCIVVNNKRTWIHTNTNRSSPLSISIGRGLERALPHIDTVDLPDFEEERDGTD